MRWLHTTRATATAVSTGVGLLLLLACNRPKADPSHDAPVASTRPAREEATGVTPSAAPTQLEASAPAPSGEELNRDPLSGFIPVSAGELLAQVRATHSQGTILAVFAHWCRSCERELPMLRGLAENYRSRGIRFLFVSVDPRDTLPQARALLTTAGVDQRGFVAAGELDRFVSELHPRWPGMLPATFLLDGNGKIRYFWGGPALEGEVVPILDGYLRGDVIDGESTVGLAPGTTVHR